MTEKTAKTAKDPVEVTDDSVTLNVGDEKVTLTEENVVKSGKQLLKATLLTVGLILGGAVVGAVAGAMIFSGAAAVAASITGFFAGGVLGRLVGGEVIKRTDAYKGMKKIADAEKKEPGSLDRFFKAVESKLDNAAKLKKGGAQKAFGEAQEPKAVTTEPAATQDAAPVKTEKKSLKK
tara:strand:- start:41 stop:574 length:534 start_codon:yes stop_codon:yes gene_type:complete